MKLKVMYEIRADIDTDRIIGKVPGHLDPLELTKHCMEDSDPSFASKVQRGDVIVAGTSGAAL
jgi:3-isopropylmalate dehydratase small subunit